jgi:hypothetical protein
MNIGDTRWFTLAVRLISSGTVCRLTFVVGVWPNGPSSISAAFLLLFCLVGAERLYDALLGIVAIAVWPDRLRSASRLHR